MFLTGGPAWAGPANIIAAVAAAASNVFIMTLFPSSLLMRGRA
jgi:hypothetical protein